MENIINALKNIKEQGSFCAKRATNTDNLHLEIKQFGQLKFPLSPRQAKVLIKLAKPAKFGWRDKTLLNKDVRNAWEISKSNIKINNKSWDKELKSVLDVLKNDLGLPKNRELQADLHNLLIYEPGQFFEYHQDSEKLDGMVATLIIVLPSPHTGGTLMIDNQGVKKQYQSSRFPMDKLTWIAFYADCHHAVKEVTEGYRLVLTYNLALKNNTRKISAPSKATSYDDVTESLRIYFNDKNSSKINPVHHKPSPKQCVYLLDHSYTQKGLSWSHLKNGDVLRAEALKTAANALDLEIYLALADVQETWDCDDDYGNKRYRERRQYYNDEEEYNENEVQVNDLIDSNTTLRHWIDQESKPLPYKECDIEKDCIGWTKASHEFNPFQSEHEGFMGNYGNTMDRWYHRAAIILWQKKDHYAVLFQMGPSSIINELLQLTKKKSQETLICHIINSLLPYWSDYLQQHSEHSLILNIFKLALYVKNSQLAQAILAGFDITALSPERTELFLLLQNTYGTPWCIHILKEWTKPKNRWAASTRYEKISEIIKNLSANQNKHKELTDWLLAYQLQTIKEEHLSYKKAYNRVILLEETPKRMKAIMDLIKACIIVNHHSVYAELLNHVIGHVDLYPAIDLVMVISYFEENFKNTTLAEWDYQKLFDHVYNELHREKISGLQKTDDWSIKEKLSCQCPDCCVLGEFLQSSKSRKIEWPLSKDRRAHIHQAIDGLGIPVTHQTKHIGSPHKLILNKTDQLHIKAKQRFTATQKALLLLAKSSKEKILHVSEEV